MNKKIAISISIIAVLLLYLVVTNIRHSGDMPDLPEMAAGADEIILTGSGGVVTLIKKDGKWTTGENGYPADTRKVGEIEKRFREVRLTDLISSKGYYARYDLTPDKYGEVIIKSKGAILRKFKIGKKSPTNRHTFIRIGDRPEIYLAEGTFDFVLNKTPEDFREREMVKIPPENVSGITIQYRGRTFDFFRSPIKKAGDASGQKSGTAWGDWSCRGYEGVTLDNARVNALIGVLNPLRASSFPEMKNEVMPPKVCTVKVTTTRKESLLTLYNKGDEYIATTSESPYVFGVAKWGIEKLLITGIDSFKAPAKK
ncbi:MAG: DUF4340 domain-containing protein [Spirochaetes bacterium]|nr:DUF4340 domain-containing protein [Spirochaetota bacterium]